MSHTIDERRTRARELRDTGASLRDIATALGVGKDTVRRDLSHPSHTPDQQKETPAMSLRERIAQRNERAYTAMRHLADAVAAIDAERVSHLIVGEPRAHQLEAEVRQHAATLRRIADDFRELYPHSPRYPGAK